MAGEADARLDGTGTRRLLRADRPITASLLLALASPAFAAKAKPQDFPDIRKWEDLHGTCYYGDPAQHDMTKICRAEEALGKKLVARGYCLYGHGVVGKTGGRVKSEYGKGEYRTRCYVITNVTE